MRLWDFDWSLVQLLLLLEGFVTDLLKHILEGEGLSHFLFGEEEFLLGNASFSY